MYVWLEIKNKSSHGYPKGVINKITSTDVMMLPKIFPSIEAVSPQKFENAVLSYGGKAYDKTVMGVGIEYYGRFIKSKFIIGSRFFNQEDLKNKARVAVISYKTKEILFGNDNDALGKKFLLNGVPFTVIGVLAKEEGRHLESEVLIPYQILEELYGDQRINYFMALLKPGTDLRQFEQSLRSYFSQKCHFDKNDKNAMGFYGTTEYFNFMFWFLIAVQLFLGGCGLIILSVGSISVANIMFLIVTERTYEIGLRKAVGATDRQIFLQLLFEVLMIVGIGGALGIIVAFFTTTFLQNLKLPDWLGVPTLSWGNAFVTVFILALVGLITGFFPARKAAKMDPIEALMA
jgi:putative ABC transport system permease protein